MQIQTWGVKTFLGRGGDSRLARLARQLEPFEREMARWERLGSRDHRYAYCFCTID
jgi:hypothetical protein